MILHVVLFNLFLALAVFGSYVCCGLLRFVPESVLPKAKREGWTFCFLGGTFRVVLFLCPWIKVEAAPGTAANWDRFLADLRLMDELRKAKPELCHPFFVWGNHTSFMDSVVCGAFTPGPVLSRIKIYAGAHLLKIPCFGSLCRWMGHFEVFFKGSTYDDFSIDKEKQAAVQVRIDNHVTCGGIMSSFPEGRVNSTPTELSPFRTGGMRQALALDGRVWMFVAVNNDKCWPAKSAVGGHPCTIKYTLTPLSPTGCKAYVAELRARKDLDPADKELEDHKLLGKFAQQDMQAQYDILRSSLDGGRGKKKKGD